jgi:hypothetical protein
LVGICIRSNVVDDDDDDDDEIDSDPIEVVLTLVPVIAEINEETIVFAILIYF